MVNIQVFDGDSGVLKISCTSTGGRPLTMSVTGPSCVVENMMNIVNVAGDMEGMGNGTFSAEIIRQKGSRGDLFVCEASNVVSNASHSVRLKGLSWF